MAASRYHPRLRCRAVSNWANHPSLQELLYRLTWWSVACLPDINVPPAIAGNMTPALLRGSMP